MLNLEAIANAPVRASAPGFLLVPGVLGAVDLAAVRADFPHIAAPGTFTLSELIYGPAFRALISELRSSAFQSVMSCKFSVDLSDKRAMISVRSRARQSGDPILADKPDEVVTCMLFLNRICDDRSGNVQFPQDDQKQSDEWPHIPFCGGTLASFMKPDGIQVGCESIEYEMRCLELSWFKQHVDRDADRPRHVRQPGQSAGSGSAHAQFSDHAPANQDAVENDRPSPVEPLEKRPSCATVA